jgi:hypothetical protein
VATPEVTLKLLTLDTLRKSKVVASLAVPSVVTLTVLKLDSAKIPAFWLFDEVTAIVSAPEPPS